MEFDRTRGEVKLTDEEKKRMDEFKNIKRDPKLHPGRSAGDKYTKEIGEKICEAVACHPWGIKRLCREYEFMPSYFTIMNWRHKHPEFDEMFNNACAQRAKLLADDTLDVSDEIPTFVDQHGITRIDYGHVQKAKLQVHTRQWVAERLNPRLYSGDWKSTEEAKEFRREIRNLHDKLNRENKKDY